MIRGGYGLYWVPPISDTGESAIGARGYSASTTFLSSTDGGLTPVGTISNPYPAGIELPQGNSLGLATGGGSVIDFVDQDSKPGYVHQYSLDWQRELPGEMAIALGYMGSRSERLSVGRHERQHDQHQPARSAVPCRWGRRCSRRSRIHSSAIRRSAT